MRKRAITSFILINAISFIVSGISNLKCDTLFQLKPNESVYKLCETNDSIIILNLDLWDGRTFYYTITSSNEFRYACIVTNSRDKSATLVWNGERKVFSDDYNSLQTCKTTLDLIDFSKCSYKYERNNEQFLVIEGIEYGPYEYVHYDPPFEHSHTYINRKYFNFTQMGSEFIHYHDGTILPTDVPRKEYYSISGLHKVIFSDNWSTVTLDDKKIEMPELKTSAYSSTGPIAVVHDSINMPEIETWEDEDFPVHIPAMKASIENCQKVCIFDNGTCLFEVVLKPIPSEEMSPFSTDTESKIIVLTTQGVQDFQFFDYYYNYRTNKIEESNFWDTLFGDKGNFQGTLLQDDTKTHYFMSKEEYNYVIIDGKKYGKRAPLEAFYVEQTNSFMWVAEEDGCLVLYTYILD